MSGLNLGRSVLIFLILIFLLAYFYPENVFGSANFGTFREGWYADGTTEIGYVDPGASMLISYGIDPNCGIPAGTLGKFRKLLVHAADVWGKPLGLQLNVTDENVKNYTIHVRVVSRETFRRMNLTDPANSASDFDRESVVGLVNRDSFKYVGTGKAVEQTANKINSVDISVYEIIQQTVYLIWDDLNDSRYQTKDYDMATWQTLICHEFGHAIGYRGHNKNKEDKPLMYFGGNDVIGWKLDGPGEYDIKHLWNVYKYLNYNKDINGNKK